jgi:hypothetical protein
LHKRDGVTIALFKDIDDADIDELVFGKFGMELGLTICPLRSSRAMVKNSVNT